MRLIDADALIKRLKPYRVEYSGDAFPYAMMHDAFIYEVEQEPTVDAQPVRHGTWRNYKDEHTCSVCGEVVTGDWMYDDSAYDYCPLCGARMDGERKEE